MQKAFSKRRIIAIWLQSADSGEWSDERRGVATGRPINRSPLSESLPHTRLDAADKTPLARTYLLPRVRKLVRPFLARIIFIEPATQFAEWPPPALAGLLICKQCLAR